MRGCGGAVRRAGYSGFGGPVLKVRDMVHHRTVPRTVPRTSHPSTIAPHLRTPAPRTAAPHLCCPLTPPAPDAGHEDTNGRGCRHPRSHGHPGKAGFAGAARTDDDHGAAAGAADGAAASRRLHPWLTRRHRLPAHHARGVRAGRIDVVRPQARARHPRGAWRSHIRLGGLALSETARLVGAGLLAGFGLAWMGASTIRGFLFRFEPLDPATLGGASASILLVALLVSLRPAIEATRVDLSLTLRDE